MEEILSRRRFAVAGVSRDPNTAGRQIYQSLKSAGYTVHAVNPNADNIDGDTCYPSLDNVVGAVDCVVTVTSPSITEDIVRDAGRLRIGYLWMQPGSESIAAFNLARAYSMQIVSGGPCILAALAARRAA